MTVMKRLIIPILLLILSQTGAFARPVAVADTVVKHNSVTRVDTIMKTDTVVRRQIIKRVEVVDRYDYIISTDSVVNPGVESKAPAGGVSTEAIAPPATEIPAIVPAVTVVPEVPVAVPAPPADARAGGEYFWVPDSLSSAVSLLLKGHSKVVDDETKIDHSEKVLFRGDTIKMILRDRNLGRFDRGLFNYLFIPKGIWQFGITASYGEFSTKDLEMFDLISDIDFSGNMFSVRPYFSYFIRSNMAFGMRLGYSSGKAHVGSFNVDVDDDINFNLKDITYRSTSYTAEATFSQYFGITRRGRFGIFNEVALALSTGNSDFIRPYAGELKQTHTTFSQIGLNFSPGLCIFIIEPVSFNVSFGVFGFTLRNEKQTVDGEDMGNRLTSGANFRFNIFNINFGIAVNI